MEGYQKVYFIGIGGIGMSALAQYLRECGIEVSGSDREETPVTEMLARKGIEVLIGQAAENMPEDADAVVYSAAIWEDNPERMCATELELPQFSYFEMLGKAAEGKRVIAVAGTHGKTTVTGMTARILRDAGTSPTAIVGSIVRDFESNYLAGNSDLFVVEACEYRRHFLNLSPAVLVITNIEWDHTDYYHDLADFQSAFRALMEKVPADGVIITNPTHPNIAPLLSGLSAPVIDYTKEPAYDVSLPGEFNQMNARAAAAAARFVLPAIDEGTLHASLGEFKGTWRRFEFKGKSKNGAFVYDDYAHHPTALKGTLAELRKRTGGRVIAAFHPHLYSRTRDLLDGFATAFVDADMIAIAPIYPAREIDDGSVSSELLAERIRSNGQDAIALASFDAIQEWFEKEGKEGDILVTLGAGDIYKVAEAIAV